MPASSRAGMSSSGMIPPAVTSTSSSPRSRSRRVTFGSRVMWAPERIERPTTSTSSWSAAVAIISGVWRRPVYTTSKPSSRRPRARTLAPRSWPSRPGFAIRILIGRSLMGGIIAGRVRPWVGAPPAGSSPARGVTRRIDASFARVSRAGRPPLEVREELRARLVTRPEEAQDVARGHHGAGLADAPHHRAEAGGLDDDPGAVRAEALLEEARDLLGQSLLDLEPAGVHLHDPRDLREPDDAAPRDCLLYTSPSPRDEVMLAQRVERDLLHDHHLAVVDVEDGTVDQALGICLLY